MSKHLWDQARRLARSHKRAARHPSVQTRIRNSRLRAAAHTLEGFVNSPAGQAAYRLLREEQLHIVLFGAWHSRVPIGGQEVHLRPGKKHLEVVVVDSDLRHLRVLTPHGAVRCAWLGLSGSRGSSPACRRIPPELFMEFLERELNGVALRILRRV